MLYFVLCYSLLINKKKTKNIKFFSINKNSINTNLPYSSVFVFYYTELKNLKVVLRQRLCHSNLSVISLLHFVKFK